MQVTLTSEINTTMWSMSTSEYGAVVTDLDDIIQCVLLILSTDKGSDPFRPEFGFNLDRLVDKPVNFVIPNGKLGILDALEQWEPRITVRKIEHTLDVSHVTFKVFCATNLGNFAVAVPISPNFNPISLGAFSSGFDSGFDIG
jgi:phage baseplate assembly protein W